METSSRGGEHGERATGSLSGGPLRVRLLFFFPSPRGSCIALPATREHIAQSVQVSANEKARGSDEDVAKQPPGVPFVCHLSNSDRNKKKEKESGGRTGRVVFLGRRRRRRAKGELVSVNNAKAYTKFYACFVSASKRDWNPRKILFFLFFFFCGRLFVFQGYERLSNFLRATFASENRAKLRRAVGLLGLPTQHATTHRHGGGLVVTGTPRFPYYLPFASVSLPRSNVTASSDSQITEAAWFNSSVYRRFPGR